MTITETAPATSSAPTFSGASSVFAKYEAKNYPHQYGVTLLVGTLAGGTPTDPKVAEGWLRTKLRDKDDVIREMVAETMVERGLSEEEATEAVAKMKHLNGFKRDENGLFIEGRQVKAMLKEAASIAVSTERIGRRGWGATNKGLASFLPEHVFVTDDRITVRRYDEDGTTLVGVEEPTGIMQRFVSTFRGTGIQYEEFVSDAVVSFTIEADYEFKEEEWAALLLTAERNGLGASRSQGYGRFRTIGFEKLVVKPKR